MLGVDDEQYGQRLAAFVVLSPAPPPRPMRSRPTCANNLANYKVPRSITVLTKLAAQQHWQDRAP